jgi:hypothetical protein
MSEIVECRSDWEYAQRPLAFTWQGQRLAIQDVIAEYQTPSDRRFLVRTAECGNFELSYDLNLDQWTIYPQPSKERA